MKLPTWADDAPKKDLRIEGNGLNCEFKVGYWWVETDRRGRKTGLRVVAHRRISVPTTEWPDGWMVDSASTYSPDLREGDIFPFAGWTCRVHSLRDGIQLERLYGEVRSRDVKVTPSGASYVVSNQGSAGVFASKNYDLHLTEITALDKKAGQWQATIQAWSTQPNPDPKYPRNNIRASTKHTLTVGDKFELGDGKGKREFVVLLIVPPDEKQQIIGWIVFDRAPAEKKEK
jgi:hypothetical protein